MATQQGPVVRDPYHQPHWISNLTLMQPLLLNSFR